MLQLIDNLLGSVSFDTFYHVVSTNTNAQGYTSYTYGWDYWQLLRYGFGCLLILLTFIIVYRIIIYIVNLLGARGSRKL